MSSIKACAICKTNFDWEEDRKKFNDDKAYDHFNPDRIMCLECVDKLYNYKRMLDISAPYRGEES